MATFTMKHELECDCERFWKLFVDVEFNVALYKALEFPEWKLLGSSFGYDEVNRFDKVSKTAKFVIKTNVLTEKLRNEGTIKCEPRGEGKSLRIVEIIAEAKVFGVGGMIESSFEKSFRTGWQQSADFVNKWVKDHS